MTRWRVSAFLLSVVLWAGCSGGDERATGDRSRSAPATVMVDGHMVHEREFARTVAGLCQAGQQAPTDLGAAKVTYDRESRAGVETTSRALQGSYSLQAARIARARDVVEADLATDPPRPALGLNLDRLTETMREGLARIGIPTSPCDG